MKVNNDDIEIVASLVEKPMKGFHGFARRELTKDDLSLPQYYMLKHLNKSTQFKMSDFKKILNITAPFATSLADQLVRKGLIGRQRNIQHRRVVNIFLTDKGRGYIKKMDKRRKQFYDSLLRNLNAGDRETLKEGQQECFRKYLRACKKGKC